jgi:hypothetical protein
MVWKNYLSTIMLMGIPFKVLLPVSDFMLVLMPMTLAQDLTAILMGLGPY